MKSLPSSARCWRCWARRARRGAPDGHRSGSRGTVKDATGAVVPGATVTVISELTGAKREAVTRKDGNYAIPLLPVSTYSVTASLQGFRAAKRTGIRLFVDQVARVDLDLQTGRADGSGRGEGRRRWRSIPRPPPSAR